MRDRMNKATSQAPKFDNQSVRGAISKVSKREHKNPITVRGPKGNTISFKPRTPKEIRKDMAKGARNRGRR